MSVIGPIVTPGLRALFDTERGSAAVNINKIQIGTIQSWTPGSQSATVQLVNQRVVFNTPQPGSQTPADPKIIPYPLLVDVPVFVLSGGTAFLGMPIAPGDPCIVLFNDRDLDPWWTTGNTGAAPNTARVHSLADGMALVGVRPSTNPIAGLPSDGQHIAMGNASGSVRQALDLLLTALLTWTNTDSTAPSATTVIALIEAKTAINGIFQ
jgi:hypothetical protein